MIRRPKCGPCPLLGDDRPCVGQNNKAACEHPREAETMVLRRPPLLAAAVELAGAVVAHAVSGSPAPPEVKAARLAICSTCDNHQGGRCRACRCSDAGLEVKAGWAEQRCPLNPPKWGPVAASETE